MLRQNTQEAPLDRAGLERFVQTTIRVSPENYPRMVDVAFDLSRIRVPGVLRKDIERRKSGKDEAGGMLLYTVWLHPEDIGPMQVYAKSLYVSTVDAEAIRRSIFGACMQMVDEQTCPEPPFKP